ncbi:MAG: tRNA pseudouridine synthase A [bacterium]|nr:tRNA pseudouridine synthase A [bacterium]
MGQRIRLTVRYDGTDFAGSQVQPGKRTVAGTLKAGLESLLGEPVKLDFASRTDAGVHADGNVCAFNADLPFASQKLPQLVSRYLPHDVVVRDADEVAADFHPRFDALSRMYVYRCSTLALPPVDRMRYVGEFPQEWRRQPLIKALTGLKGRHDFSSFSASGLEPQDSECEIHHAAEDLSESEMVFSLSANRFLRHMVVRLIGALAKVGSGEESPEAFLAMLHSGKRFQFRPAPAKGLTLVAVEYKAGVRTQ